MGASMNREGVFAFAWKYVRAALFSAFPILLLVSANPAQQVTGRILGTVTDPSGSAVANAQITITNQGTGAVRVVTTGPEGLYNAPQISAGTYTIEAAAPGFSQTQEKDVVVDVASDVRV